MNRTVWDAENWISKLKSRGITEFMHKDLPEDLRNMKMIQKCRHSGLIEKIKKVDSRIMWRIL